MRTAQLRVLTKEEMERLVIVREKVRAGLYSEETPDSKKLLFGRWLVMTGRVSDDVRR